MHPLASHIVMRPFGELADLDLDLADRDRPRLVTALLSQCGSGTDAAAAGDGDWGDWDQPLP